MKIEDYVKCNIDKNELPLNMPEFYKEVLSAWFSLKSEPKTANNICREVIWNNRFIEIANHTIYNRKLYENGMIYIDVILDDNGIFLPFETLADTFGNHFSAYYYTCLKDAIPKSWRTLIKENNNFNINQRGNSLSRLTKQKICLNFAFFMF